MCLGSISYSATNHLNKGYRRRLLLDCEVISCDGDVFNPNGIRVCSLAMMGALRIVYHLVNVPILVNNVVR